MRGGLAGLLMGLAMAGVGLVAQATHHAPSSSAKHYIATLVPLNTQVTGSKARGELRLTVSGDTLTISLSAQGLPADMVHMAHLHGFADGSPAACPAASADTNHDGVVDLVETEAAGGVTLVPFNHDPAALDVPGPGYPAASRSGRLSYHHTTSLAQLNQALAAADQGASLDLDKRVVFIHGVPAGTHLPATAQSLPGVPAQATLPIACGVIHLVH